MPVLIKEIDPNLYSKFKIKALNEGLKIDEAFAKALELWLKSDTATSPRELQQKENERALRLMKDSLEKKYPNSWIAIVDGKVLAVAESCEKLLAELKIKKTTDAPGIIFQTGMKPRYVRLGYKRVARNEN